MEIDEKFNEWLENNFPNRLHDSHAIFTIDDLKKAFIDGYLNNNKEEIC